MTHTSTRKRLPIALGVTASLVTLLVLSFCAWVLTLPHTFSMGKCKFDGGVVVYYWTEIGLDFAVDYYRIEENGKIVVPATYFANNGAYRPFPKHQYQTSDGKLLAVTHELTGAGNRIMIYDTVSKESWPGNLTDDGSHHRPEIIAKWHSRYAKLKAEHPDLIEDWYFTQEWLAHHGKQ